MNIGIDIVEVKRIKKLLNKKKFINKVFSEKEIKYCDKFKNKAERYSGKFAAKEAFIKAIKSCNVKKVSDMADKISLKDIQILNKENGMPFILINGIEVKGKLSISHTPSYACAFFMLEGLKSQWKLQRNI